MNKKHLAILVIAVIVPIGTYLVMFPKGTSFHYEKTSTADYADYTVGIEHVKDSTINIEFVNDAINITFAFT